MTTQPICFVCWKVSNPTGSPTAVLADTSERCCMCGVLTLSGIFVELDPASVRYPAEEVAR